MSDEEMEEERFALFNNEHFLFTDKKINFSCICVLFLGWWARTILVHKLCKTNERAQLVRMFYTTSEQSRTSELTVK